MPSSSGGRTNSPPAWAALRRLILRPGDLQHLAAGHVLQDRLLASGPGDLDNIDGGGLAETEMKAVASYIQGLH